MNDGSEAVAEFADRGEILNHACFIVSEHDTDQTDSVILCISRNEPTLERFQTNAAG